jgi:hypothetical protein
MVQSVRLEIRMGRGDGRKPALRALLSLSDVFRLTFFVRPRDYGLACRF